MLELSVVICAHNPRPHRVLEALRSQTLPKQQWELLLIDNSSSDPLMAQWDLSWHPNGRHMFQAANTSHLLLTYKWSGSVPNYPFGPRALLSILKNWVTKRGLDRRRYFAYVRAVIEARSLMPGICRFGKLLSRRNWW
jgi:hypothetical protein